MKNLDVDIRVHSASSAMRQMVVSFGTITSLNYNKDSDRIEQVVTKISLDL